MPEESVKRLVAQKVSIKDILQGEYIKEGGWDPNYVIVGKKKVSRVNVMAVVLSKDEQKDTNYSSVFLDDGTGNISVRSFEKNENMENLEIGDIVLLIGRLREFGQERYIIPEVIRKIEDRGWVEVRKLELGREKKETRSVQEKEEPVEEEVIVDSSSQVIYDLIKKLDKGGGVDFDNVMKNSKLDNTEELISNLLQEGEIFELKPGKLKILE